MTWFNYYVPFFARKFSQIETLESSASVRRILISNDLGATCDTCMPLSLLLSTRRQSGHRVFCVLEVSMSRSVAHVEVGCRLYRLTGESMRRHKIKRPRQKVGSRSNCPRLHNGLICFSILLSGRELQCAFAACDLVAKAIASGFAISQRRRTNCCKR